MEISHPRGSDCKAPTHNEGDPGLIPGLGRSPAEGNGNALQYSCLENSIDGGAWWATVHWVAKSRTQLSNLTFTYYWNKRYTIILKWCPTSETPKRLSKVS